MKDFFRPNANHWKLPHWKVLAVVGGIILLNFLCFGIQQLDGGPKGMFTREGGLAENAVTAGGQYWRIISSGFLHENWEHIFGNMTALLILGLWLGQKVGWQRTLQAYIVGLLGSSFLAMTLQAGSMTIGASGAIFGLAGALAMVGWRMKAPLAMLIAGLWTVYSFYMTMQIPGIAWAAHLGGLIAGLIFGYLLVNKEGTTYDDKNNWLRFGAVCLACLILTGSIA